jgi:hypothetical protein
MRPSGLEPPRTIQSTRPSTLRVYQFRHRRKGGEYSLHALCACIRPLVALLYEHMFVLGNNSADWGAQQTWI